MSYDEIEEGAIESWDAFKDALEAATWHTLLTLPDGVIEVAENEIHIDFDEYDALDPVDPDDEYGRRWLDADPPHGFTCQSLLEAVVDTAPGFSWETELRLIRIGDDFAYLGVYSEGAIALQVSMRMRPVNSAAVTSAALMELAHLETSSDPYLFGFSLPDWIRNRHPELLSRAAVRAAFLLVAQSRAKEGDGVESSDSQDEFDKRFDKAYEQV